VRRLTNMITLEAAASFVTTTTKFGGGGDVQCFCA
jgi:putative transposon-encoded protein